MVHFVKKMVLKALSNIGFDITRRSSDSLLGLRSRPIHSIIDVGANTGQFAKVISNIFPLAYMYCFEPLPDPFEKLSKWAEHRQGRVTVFNVALGDTDGEARMLVHLDHTPSSSLLETTGLSKKLYPFTRKQAVLTVKITTLDKAMANVTNPINPDILVKIDVQGYEDRVIRGGVETLLKSRACILEICLEPLYEDQVSFYEIVSLLYKFGYHYGGNLDQVYSKDGYVIYVNALFLNGNFDYS